jgi:hypothetical protein
MNRNNSNNRNHKGNRSNRNKRNGQRGQHNDKQEQKDKTVPMRYQIRNSKETNTVELKCTDLDGAVDKTKLNIYGDGTDEEFLKLLKGFQIMSALTKFGMMRMPPTPFTKAFEDASPELQETFGIKSTY